MEKLKNEKKKGSRMTIKKVMEISYKIQFLRLMMRGKMPEEDAQRDIDKKLYAEFSKLTKKEQKAKNKELHDLVMNR